MNTASAGALRSVAAPPAADVDDARRQQQAVARFVGLLDDIRNRRLDPNAELAAVFHPSPKIREETARYSNDPEILNVAVMDDDERVAIAAIDNLAIDQQTLRFAWVNSPNGSQRRNAVYVSSAAYKDPWFHREFTRDPLTPPWVLARVAEVSNDPEVLGFLMSHRSPSVRRRASENPYTPIAVVAPHVHDDDPLVSRSAAEAVAAERGV
jgi:membrane-bound inhibitor of C-type lysozyme